MTDTFYDVLGVSPDATIEEIEDAYRERLKQSHPDLSDDADAEERTKRVIRARDVLTSETERERYDRLGHQAYTRNSTSSVDESDVSSAAAAARRAGWGGDPDANSDPGDVDSGTDTASARRKARERRRRERTARERVTGEANSTGASRARRGPRTARASDAAAGGVTGRATGDGVGSAYNSRVSDSSPSWQDGGGYSVRRDVDVPVNAAGLFDQSQSLTLLAIAFALYPVMLFSAIFPPFPLVFNLSVAVCAVFFVGYLQSVPEVGVVVFGSWSVLTPLALTVVDLDLTGLVGITAILGTVVPFGLSTLTYWVMRG